ncbi:MAG: TetR family transcriptional regulator C-terminal domain-containing protein [Cytophagales bacterium]|nr:TetR family transcriptional regulator C-terminal domain-containing protein [Cytophagales bacterium]MDW8384528.1 TetR family transcriptional regulator C-terminal domain-containing protein [Flammeovirgaceae bacterium]
MENLLDKICKNYIRYVLTQGKRPSSVFAFMQEIGQEEKEFYKYFASFEAIEESVWSTIIENTLKRIKEENVYSEYSIREKLLSFCFTLVDEMKNERSFLIFCVKNNTSPSRFLFTCPNFLKGFKKKFRKFAEELITEGTDSHEIPTRPFFAERYPDILWLQVQSVINYWVSDYSNNFEKTDEFIEKSVNLTFDILGRNALDSTFEFAKFIFQQS